MGALLMGGCGEHKPSVEVMPLSGKIEKIERTTDETGKITVLYYSEKHGQDMPGTGLVTRETEIMIDGAIGKLKDLREGDRVTGQVRVERAGKERKHTAVRIHVERPKAPPGG
jgi:transcription termination factor Rho